MRPYSRLGTPGVPPPPGMCQWQGFSGRKAWQCCADASTGGLVLQSSVLCLCSSLHRQVLQRLNDLSGANGGHRLLTQAPCAAVTLNDEKLAIHEAHTELEVIPYVEKGEFLLLWQKHRPSLGNSVELTTGEMPSLLE